MSKSFLPAASTRRFKTLLLFLQRGPMTVDQAMCHNAAWFNFGTKAIFRKELESMVEYGYLIFDGATLAYALSEPACEELADIGHETRQLGEKVKPAYYPAFRSLQLKNLPSLYARRHDAGPVLERSHFSTEISLSPFGQRNK
jgi:hypothetical protein